MRKRPWARNRRGSHAWRRARGCGPPRLGSPRRRGARALRAERIGEISVDEGMLGRDLGGRTPRDLASDRARLEQRNRAPGARQLECRGQSDDASADNGDVVAMVAGKAFVTGRRDGRHPAAFRFTGDLIHDRLATSSAPYRRCRNDSRCADWFPGVPRREERHRTARWSSAGNAPNSYWQRHQVVPFVVHVAMRCGEGPHCKAPRASRSRIVRPGTVSRRS
jgi:hypothetical protein